MKHKVIFAAGESRSLCSDSCCLCPHHTDEEPGAAPRLSEGPHTPDQWVSNAGCTFCLFFKSALAYVMLHFSKWKGFFSSHVTLGGL